MHANAASLATELERTRSILGALVGLNWAVLYERLSPQLRFENMLAALKTLFKAESLQQPLIIHLEDAHWLDADSAAFMAQLVRNVEGFRLW
ncbi:ATP-binding protein [Chloroflexi bacterium TSY]|nr:ATP-binding protein [Chloroflexi bacterium TSY]